MRNEGSEVKKISKIILAGKVGKMVAGENGLKNSPIENSPIQCFPSHRSNLTNWSDHPLIKSHTVLFLADCHFYCSFG
jgi:hypothetical protein